MAKDKELLQWHPAFFAGLQIELQEDVDHLTFLNEYQLGTKPKQIDVLVIKKEANYTVKKNFGRFFENTTFSSVTTQMFTEYMQHQDNALYDSVMDIVIRANHDSFCKEDTPMCHEFEKLMNQKLEAREARGIAIGEARGIEIGEARLLAAKRQMVINLHNQNMPIEQIAAVVDEPLQTVLKWLQG